MERNSGSKPGKDPRKWARAELTGRHTYRTWNGITIYIALRKGKFVARFRLHGRMAMKTLGPDEASATSSLNRIIVELEDGRFVRPQDARRLAFPVSPIRRLSLRELLNAFLDEKRRLKGQATSNTYCSRLMPVLQFAESAGNLKRWPHASTLNRDFAIALRQFLFAEYRTTPNGRPGATARPASERQIRNILETLRTCLNWAAHKTIRKLPDDWVSPMTPDIVGEKTRKDPLRQLKLPIEERVAIVKAMDVWQLCHLALSVVLPSRPEELAGLLINEIRWDERFLIFGTRFQGADFNKGKQNFVLPYPAQLEPILKYCVGSRAAGPLLRSRLADGGKCKTQITSDDELKARFEPERLRSSADNPQDCKRALRRVLRRIGGVSTKQLAREFHQARRAAGFTERVRFYDLRHTTSSEMRHSGIRDFDLLYFTGHANRGIMEEYVPVSPHEAIAPYFAMIGPLLVAIATRSAELGITPVDEMPSSPREPKNAVLKKKVAASDPSEHKAA